MNQPSFSAARCFTRSAAKSSPEGPAQSIAALSMFVKILSFACSPSSTVMTVRFGTASTNAVSFMRMSACRAPFAAMRSTMPSRRSSSCGESTISRSSSRRTACREKFTRRSDAASTSAKLVRTSPRSSVFPLSSYGIPADNAPSVCGTDIVFIPPPPIFYNIKYNIFLLTIFIS